MSGPVLALEAVGKSFASASGAVEVLRGIDLAVRPGEFLAVTGPSGSGKTTLLHLAGLLDLPTAGRVLFGGRDVGQAGARALVELRKRHIGTVYQQFHLLPNRTALDNVVFRFRYLGVPIPEARARSREALDRFGLGPAAGRPVRLLSGGEMQRVAIARAIVVPPRLLIADEPTGNLDASAARGVMDCFHELHRAGHTILLATHNPAWLDETESVYRLGAK